MPADGNMSLADHLRELRYRVVVALIAVTVMTIVAAFFYQDLLSLLMLPWHQAQEALLAERPGQELQVANIGVTAPLTLAIKICAVAGVVVSSPLWIYQLWAFIAPGLLAKEKKWALAFVGSATPLFLAGVAAGYFVLPKGIQVMLGFTPESQQITNLLDLSTFLNFMLRLMLVFGIGFLLPVAVVALNLMGVVTWEQLAKARVYVVFGTFVFGAVATPSTDPFSMLVLAIPMAVLYLIAEFLCWINDRRKRKRGAQTSDLEVTT
ncbi:sec-independent protein translocase protein TatC [Propioniferax innocua]|uniref:Sec-independent protein translocase protein TatC n=2 Tax=Propioniferax innocua TaxID=1753 RepID=A0A542Z7E8_9ACTN|nr:sec-independent protein translocase protein TatC [Propioniferax innocua]